MKVASAVARVLIVSGRADLSGAPRCVLDLVRGLDRDRFQPEVVLGETGALSRYLGAEGVGVDVVDGRKIRALTGIFDAVNTIRRSRPDLVHVNRAVAFSKKFALASRLAGVPVVWHLHDEFVNSRMRRRIPWIRRLATRVVSCSERVASQARIDGTVLIANGTRFDGLAPTDELRDRAARHGVTDSPFRFLFVGMIEPRKNVHLLVESAQRVLDRHPRTDFLAVGGGNWPEYRKQVAEKIAALGLGERFRLLEAQEDVAPFYAASNVLVLPSSSEAFPRVILEAGAHGLPTVATAVGDLPRLIRDGETGWLIDPNELDADRLAGELCVVRGLGAEAVAARGRAAHQWLRDRYDIHDYVDAFEALYDEILGRTRVPRGSPAMANSNG
ncbi:MAG: glycosyltransferase [Planctomycetes bacterium]|nr:glycosyltransferase [Planctomycetota bacterium]MBI3844984.1 glycosyltransferase [Planctomycetota bacterium]